MTVDAFSLLARPIQHVLWDMQWEALRPIQVQAIQCILQSDRDLIISAQTAAGKTEAAFLPILTSICERPQPSVQAVYVGPLKALINDQFRRLDDLCRRTEITVHRWHGDVDAFQRNRLLNRPGGVLLITPESLESMLVNRSTFLTRLFRHLSFIVIDEIHALVGRERGTHLRSLLYRIARYVDGGVRMVGLSATLGQAFPMYAQWVRPDEPQRVTLIEDTGEQKRVLYKVHAYVRASKLKKDRPREDESQDGRPEKEAELAPADMVQQMYQHMAGKKNLLFANIKSDVEWFADSLNELGRQFGRTDEFLVHHGSVSKEVREFTEQVMQGDRPHTTVCSSTLELGIDIGNVTSVGQIGPPWSVSSLIQRLGRSGRRENEPQCMRVYLSEVAADDDTSLVDRLYPNLLRTIAVTELMLAKPRWVEPPAIDAYDFSTLTQQVLSVLAETGGIHASELYERLCSGGAFRTVTRSQFAMLLRSLRKRNLIQQMQQGDLILAPEGEAIVNHYKFYSAFATPIEYTVYHGSRRIGALPWEYLPREGDHFLLAGRRWRAVQINHERHEILVAPAPGRKAPAFGGKGGEIHPRVGQMMREVLLGTQQYPYLNPTAARLLEDARTTAAQAGLAEHSLVELGPSSCVWFPWTGTRILRALFLIAGAAGLDPSNERIAIQFSGSVSKVRSSLAETLERNLDAATLASTWPMKQTRKFDQYVSEDLLTIAVAHDVIDLEGAKQLVRELVEQA